MFKKIVLTTLAVMMLMTIFSGCTPFDAERGDYWNNTRMDALNYSQYVGKELSMMMNELESRMTNAKQLEGKSIAVEDEIEYANQSLVLIQEAIDTISKINPPETYDDDREATLKCMNDAKDSVTAYIDYLESGNTDKLTDYIEDMQLRFSALSSRFNNWTQ